MIAFIAMATPIAASSKDNRTPVPDAASQEKAEKLIKELFQDEYAKKAPRDKLTLADKLLEQANETKDDLAARFVLMREARDLAVEAGDPIEALKVVDSMAKEYAVNAVTMKTTVLQAVKKWTSPARNKILVDAVVPIVDDALAADDFDSADKLLKIGEAAARKTRNVALVTSILSRMKQVEGLRKVRHDVLPAIVALAKDPKDPNANLSVGKYLCFTKGDWDNGLPKLALGADAKLKAIAEKDLGSPTDAAERAELGDAWWDLAEAEKGSVKMLMRGRAHHWYKVAVPELTGLTKTKVEKRLTQLAAPLTKADSSNREEQYLSDMEAFDVKVSEGRFANKGSLGYRAGNPQSDRILVKGKQSPNGISMHGISNDHAVAKYRLGNTARTFIASVALNDSAGGAGQPPGVGKIPSPLHFQVLGDGKVLWKSKPVDTARKVQECEVDVSGIDVLELHVVCPGDYTNAQAVWLEPRALLK
jgi:hypothetical protein